MESTKSQAEKFPNGERKKSFVERLRSENDKYPISYLEFRESEYKISKERSEVMRDIGKSIRDKCRAEIDEYVNCCSEKRFIIFNCKEESKELHRCIRKYQKDATTPEAIKKVIKDRYDKGETEAVPSYLMRKTNKGT